MKLIKFRLNLLQYKNFLDNQVVDTSSKLSKNVVEKPRLFSFQVVYDHFSNDNDLTDLWMSTISDVISYIYRISMKILCTV